MNRETNVVAESLGSDVSEFPKWMQVLNLRMHKHAHTHTRVFCKRRLVEERKEVQTAQKLFGSIKTRGACNDLQRVQKDSGVNGEQDDRQIQF